jgi:U4/U6.U5 tri-snRNP-associated protein 2
LPEGYQVSDPSLQDIISVLNPRFNPAQLPSLSLLPSKSSYTLDAQPYVPGYIGLNNIRANDYSNVIVHLLLHIPPVRDYFLSPSTPQLQMEARPTELVRRFASLARRVWNPKLFKAQVSPHEFLQEVTKRSEGKFGITEQGDPVAFLGWLLNTLHRDLGGSKKSNSSALSLSTYLFKRSNSVLTMFLLVDRRDIQDIPRRSPDPDARGHCRQTSLASSV